MLIKYLRSLDFSFWFRAICDSSSGQLMSGFRTVTNTNDFHTARYIRTVINQSKIYSYKAQQPRGVLRGSQSAHFRVFNWSNERHFTYGLSRAFKQLEKLIYISLELLVKTESTVYAFSVSASYISCFTDFRVACIVLLGIYAEKHLN